MAKPFMEVGLLKYHVECIGIIGTKLTLKSIGCRHRVRWDLFSSRNTVSVYAMQHVFEHVRVEYLKSSACLLRFIQYPRSSAAT